MFEKVNPMHPDKIADRIAGAIVDLAYKIRPNPKIAVEVLLGHGKCLTIIETDCILTHYAVEKIVHRIGGDLSVEVLLVPQDPYLSNNQKNLVRCGDNGIFKGIPTTDEQSKLTSIAREIFEMCPKDGKYIIDADKLIICQSNLTKKLLKQHFPQAIVNPLGNWTGGTDVDCGATNRKLGSDMGDAVTGGGLHGKDLSKADVSVNIYAHLKAQEIGEEVSFSCAIGDEEIDGIPYQEIVDIAGEYIQSIGGFEAFAEWGLI